MIQILFTKLQQKLNDDLYKHYLNILPAGIQNKINRYHFWQDAHRSLFGNLLLIKGIESIGAKNQTLNELSYNLYARPCINNLDFNISHSGNFVICAISKESKVGVDVEEVKDIPVEDFTEEFSAIEMAAIVADKSLRYFYHLWTQKEAFLKAIGKGLSVPLNKVAVTDNCIIWEGKNWFLKEIYLNKNYKSHLCVNMENAETALKEISFYEPTDNP